MHIFMSVSYDVGFIRKPEVNGLDGFMQSLGFKIESPDQREGKFTRVYILCDESVPREIEFFYEENPRGHKSLFGKRGKEVKAYGNLKTFLVEQAVPDLAERKRIIDERKIVREHDCYKYLDTERLKFYETALAIRDRFNAIVVSEQTGQEINPDRNPFVWAADLRR